VEEETVSCAESLGVNCPRCGHWNTASLSYSDEETLDYEGLCKGEFGGFKQCGVRLLITVTLPNDEA
jgi:hypothetical protein